ncbi:39S ribosomal protein L21, mitochondrial-like [Pomacea canaliculata]|uniref:39S ribosomal protein L21, mitochondrial-like n=1 Tax=Pomacea canaliculata TaxID=400727 RepID=UPI000D727D71|nr:39S ribosomal protein L21, mitochondrial-like [Pomacea canaliculata]
MASLTFSQPFLLENVRLLRLNKGLKTFVYHHHATSKGGRSQVMTSTFQASKSCLPQSRIMACNSCRSLLPSACRLFKQVLRSGASFSQFHSSCAILHSPSLVSSMPSDTTAATHRLCSVSSPVVLQCRGANWYIDKRISNNLGVYGIADVEPDFTNITDKTESQELAKMVNETFENGEQGRLFAVVSIAAVQRRVTVEDIIIVEAEFPPNIGDRIRLEKVLMVGGKDFSLFGQPLLSRDQVKIEATVVEQTLSHNRVWATYKRRSRFRKMKVCRNPQCMLVINSIELSMLPET